MWTRARFLVAAELASAGAFAAGVAAGGFGLFGVVGGLAAGLVTSGAIGFYLANSYSIGGISDERPAPDRT